MLSSENNRVRINGSRLVSPSLLEKHRDESQMEMDEVIPALSSKFFLFVFPFLLSISYSFPFILLVMHTGTDLSSTGDDDFMLST